MADKAFPMQADITWGDRPWLPEPRPRENKRLTDPAQIAALMAGRGDRERQLAESEARVADR
jgi:hypothetical protein